MSTSEPFEREWPAEAPKAFVALVHGLAEHSGRYEHVAEHLRSHGYSVRAVDLRGHGRSAGFPSGVEALFDWLDDANGLVDRVRAAAGDLPVFLLGHSLGALICATCVARGTEVDGLILSGIAVLAGDMLLASMSNPDDQGLPPEAISRDPAVVAAYRDDPLVFHDRVTPEANAFALEAAIEVNQSAGGIAVPTLLVHGSEDRIADVEGARELHASVGASDKEIIVYDGLYHEVLNEPEREQVLDDIVAWLDRHAAG